MSKAELEQKFDEKAGEKAESEASLENLPESKEMDLSYLIEDASQALEEVKDAELMSVLKLVVSHAWASRAKQLRDSSELLSQQSEYVSYSCKLKW